MPYKSTSPYADYIAARDDKKWREISDNLAQEKEQQLLKKLSYESGYTRKDGRAATRPANEK